MHLRSVLALGASLFLGTVVASGCRPKASRVEAADDPAILLADTSAVCTAMATGDVYAWRTPIVKSATWNMLIARSEAGDDAANCEAAKLINRRWQQTLTCTASLAIKLAERSRCKLPAGSRS